MVDTKVYKITGDLLAASPDLWEFVKHGLLEVKRKVGDRAKWEPLHVRKSIETNGSELWVVYDSSSQPQGYYILTITNDPFVNIPSSVGLDSLQR